MDLIQAKELFLIDQQLRGNSERTVKVYDEYITYFINYVTNIDINDIEKQTIVDYQLHLLNRNVITNKYCKNKKNKKLSKFTIKGYITHLRAFFNYLYAENYMNVKIFDKYKMVKLPKQVKKILSDFEIEQVLFSFSDNMLGCRNKCMFLLLVDSGLRVQEVSGLDIKDVIFTQNRLHIRDSKGEKDRIVPITLNTKKELLKYLKFYRPATELSETAFFLSNTKDRISENAIQNVLARIRNRLDLEKLNPHFLRRTFATRYIINGGDMSTLQMILGHEDIETTRQYVHLANYYIEMDFDKFSTVSKIMINKKKCRK